MKFPGSALLGEEHGQSVVELALVLPVLIALVIGIFDYSCAIQANNIITNMSREGANLASRTSIPLDVIMASLASTAQPLALQNKGAMYITKVTNDEGTLKVKLPVDSWGKANGLPSKVDGANLAGTLKSITVQPGESVFISEVLYRYEFLLVPSYSIVLSSFTIL
jgi:hypothetical protein